MSRHKNSGICGSRDNKRSRLPDPTRSRSPNYKRSKYLNTSLRSGYESKNGVRQFEDLLVSFLYFTLDFNSFIVIL